MFDDVPDEILAEATMATAQEHIGALKTENARLQRIIAQIFFALYPPEVDVQAEGREIVEFEEVPSRVARLVGERDRLGEGVDAMAALWLRMKGTPDGLLAVLIDRDVDAEVAVDVANRARGFHEAGTGRAADEKEDTVTEEEFPSLPPERGMSWFHIASAVLLLLGLLALAVEWYTLGFVILVVSAAVAWWATWVGIRRTPQRSDGG